MDNLTEIENNKAQIIELLNKRDSARTQIWETKCDIKKINIEFKAFKERHYEQIDEIKEKIDNLEKDLSTLEKEENPKNKDLFNEKLQEIESKISRYNEQVEGAIEFFYGREYKFKQKESNLKKQIAKDEEDIVNWSFKISKLSAINRALDAASQSIQVKVTLNIEENIILEELVKEKGSNKSSVLRDMIKDYRNINKERDSLKQSSDSLIQDMKNRFQLFEQEKKAELEQIRNKLEIDFTRKIQEREKLIISLEGKLKNLIQEKNRELEIINLQEEKYESMLKERDTTIEELRSMRTLIKNGIQLTGEELESFCEKEFNKIRSLAFPKAFFEKQITLDSSKKADLIFRDFDENGNEILSIIFEFKEKSFDKRSIQKLDELRNESKCDYAILISDYVQERASENDGIIDLCHEYSKMFVVRSNYFMPMLSILKNVTADHESVKKDTHIITEYIEPKNFDALPGIIETLQSGSMVIINLNSIDTKERQRFSDMLLGATFGIKGSIKNIGDLTYIFTPLNHLIKEHKVEKKDLGDDTENFLNSGLPNK